MRTSPRDLDDSWASAERPSLPVRDRRRRTDRLAPLPGRVDCKRDKGPVGSWDCLQSWLVFDDQLEMTVIERGPWGKPHLRNALTLTGPLHLERPMVAVRVIARFSKQHE